MGISKLALAAALAAVGMSGAAQAVPATSDADGQVLILVPLQLTKITDLDFGTVVPSADPGVVSISPVDGQRGFGGGVTGSGTGGERATFGGAGSPGQQVIMSIDAPAALTSSAGDTVPVLELVLDGPATRTVDPVSRAFYVGVGGSLQIAADQPEGDYSADFVVTANYQ